MDLLALAGGVEDPEVRTFGSGVLPCSVTPGGRSNVATMPFSLSPQETRWSLYGWLELMSPGARVG